MHPSGHLASPLDPWLWEDTSESWFLLALIFEGCRLQSRTSGIVCLSPEEEKKIINTFTTKKSLHNNSTSTKRVFSICSNDPTYSSVLSCSHFIQTENSIWGVIGSFSNYYSAQSLEFLEWSDNANQLDYTYKNIKLHVRINGEQQG